MCIRDRADVVINVGVSGPGVVQRAVEKVPGESFDVLAETVKKTDVYKRQFQD